MFDLEALAAVDPSSDQALLVEQIGWLERVKSAAAAGQARAAALWDEKRRADEAAAGVPTARQGRGVSGEVALARRDSPARGGRHLGLAKALVHEMPHTLAALECGALSEWRATLIVRESACLEAADRRGLGCRTVRRRRQARGHGGRAGGRGGQADRRPVGCGRGGGSSGQGGEGSHGDASGRRRIA